MSLRGAIRALRWRTEVLVARTPRLPRGGPRLQASFEGPIVGVDVETACSERGAVCSIGVSIVARGAVVRERQWFVDPKTRFDPRFIAIHGIEPHAVRGQPSLVEVWPEVCRFTSDAVLAAQQPSLFSRVEAESLQELPALYVAHNAQFDRMQIEGALQTPLPFRLACTVAMSRRAFPALSRHNLATVAAHLRIQLQHHDALSDARACALIAHQCIVRGRGN